jgi:AcrR family transcriptional regulator
MQAKHDPTQFARTTFGANSIGKSHRYWQKLLSLSATSRRLWLCPERGGRHFLPGLKALAPLAAIFMARTPKIVEDRREQIIDAALCVFAQKGFSGATNWDIAREAGITPGLIYHYFKNKEALLNAIIETRSPIQAVRSLPAHVLDMPPEAVLPYLVRQVLAIVENEQFVQLIRVVLSETLHNPTFSPLGLSAFQNGLGILSNYMAAQMEKQRLRQADASLTAQVLIGALMGFVLRRQVLHDPLALQYSHEQIAVAVVDTLLQGLLPR